MKFRESVVPRAMYSSEEYWRKPVPGFGDINARLLVLGLAPAQHGGNRTGRVFTGDDSGRFLVKVLYHAGFANQSVTESRKDGLVFYDCYVTAAVKCVPPGDRPTPQEFENCSPYLEEEIALLRNLKAVLVLGALSFRAFLEYAERRSASVRGLRFKHGATYRIAGLPTMYASYHPSPRNTNTGKLTSSMLLSVLDSIKREFRTEVSSKHN